MAKTTVNSDIYNLAKLVDSVKATFIPDDNEETLAISTYGYIGALESYRLQTQVQMTGELCNEVFPSRARLERNIITHAIMANIENINAIPAKISVFLAIRETDIENFFDPTTNIFIIDRECPIYIGNFEFHLDYDVKLKRIKLPNNYTQSANTSPSGYAYTAQYDIPPNREVPTASSISSTGYLSPPAVVNVEGEYYIYLTIPLSQVEHSIVSKKLVTSNIIDNKTMNFEFENQLAYFEIHCKEANEEYYLIPVFEGSSVPDTNSRYYCWYQYIDSNIVRIRFDRKSYMPGLNTTVECLIKTCQGANGNFTYNTDTYITLTSEKYGYKNITCLLTPITDSMNGKDRKSKRELQGLIPKEFLARGCLTTITDLNNYFGMINSEVGRILIQKKIDNQIERIYYAYLVAKDANDNIIPSNTVDIKVKLDDLIDSRFYSTDPPRYILPAGARFRLGSDGVAYIDDTPILDKRYEFIVPESVQRGDLVTVDFTVEVVSNEYVPVSCGVNVGGCDTSTHVFPKYGDDRFVMKESSVNNMVENYMQMGVGQNYTYSTTYITNSAYSPITLTDDNLDCLDFVEAYYTVDGVTKRVSSLPLTVYGYPEDTKIIFGITKKLNTKACGIIYFSNTEMFVDTYKFNQTKEGKLSTILEALGFSGHIIEAESGDSTKISLTPNGTITPEPSTGGPYKLFVVDPSNMPDVFSRNENEWFYVVEKTIERDEEDIHDTDSDDEFPYKLRVLDEESLPPIDERTENEWFYVVEMTKEKDDESDSSNGYIDTDEEYKLYVEKDSNLPPIDEREENNWWYSVYYSQFRETIKDPEIILTGQEYDVIVEDNFQGTIIPLYVIIDDVVYTIYVKQDRNVLENSLYLSENDQPVQETLFHTYVPSLDQDVWPSALVVGDKINYHLQYKSSGYSYRPNIAIELSRGLKYVDFSNTITYPSGRTAQYEPSETSIKSENQFIYTNPYTISINGYRLYSAFYMLATDENPYLHFDYINDKSNVQFIATNIHWSRPFTGENTDKYTLTCTLVQSVQGDLGIAPDGMIDEGLQEYFTPLVKAIAVFMRDGKPYRYRSLDLVSYDPLSYSYTFSQTFISQDVFDNENNIELINVRPVGQNEYTVTLSAEDKSYILHTGESVNLSDLLEALEISLEDNIDTVESSNRKVLDIYRENEDSDYRITSFMDFSETVTLTITDMADNVYTISATSKGPNSYSIRIGESVSNPNNFHKDFNISGTFRISEVLDFYEIEYTKIKSVAYTYPKHIKAYPIVDEETQEITDFEIAIDGEVYGGLKIDYDTSSVFFQIYSYSTPEYGFFNPTSNVKIYAFCGIPDISGNYSKNDLNSICPGLSNWTLTNVYSIVNGVTMYHNYSEIMGSRCTPYGTDVEYEDGSKHLDVEGYYVKGVPLLGYDYCQDEELAQAAIAALNYRKVYIDRAVKLLENSFGIDFKLFNTYGPSHIYYVIVDKDKNNLLDDITEPIGRVNITLNFRIKLVSTHDSYTKDNIVRDVKAYIEDLDDISELHIPNLVTQITNAYKEQIYYFEYLGINNFGPDVQHLYRIPDDEIPIHTAPEFLNINNIINNNGTTTPDINIYISEI